MSIITEIEVTMLTPKNGLVAIASCVYNNALFLSSLGIMTRLSGGYRVTYPTKKFGPDGERIINIYRPINKDVGALIESAILTKYLDLTKGDVDILASLYVDYREQ